MDVFIKKIRYIKGIPEALTEKALKAGEVKRGSILGLDVEFKDCHTEALIELRLTKTEQNNLIKKGKLIPVEEFNSTYYMMDGWMEYMQAQSNTASKRTKAIEVEPKIEPIKSRF